MNLHRDSMITNMTKTITSVNYDEATVGGSIVKNNASNKKRN